MENSDTPQFVPTSFKTDLKLTDEQEGKMMFRIVQRIQEVMGEMGLGQSGSLDGWMGQRRMRELQYANNFEWRRMLGGVFQHSNFSLNISRRFARLGAARSSNELVGTEPFFAAIPRNPFASKVSKQVEKYVQEHVEASNLRKTLQEAFLVAGIMGEAVVKTTYTRNATHYRGAATILVNQTGEPVKTSRGDYIYYKDNFLQSNLIEGQIVLEKDPSIVATPTQDPTIIQVNVFPALNKPQFAHFQSFEDLDQVLWNYEGLDAQVLDYRDFLCPLAAPTVYAADINVHCYDEDTELLEEIYKGTDIAKSWVSETGEPKSLGAAQAKPEHSEIQSGSQVVRRTQVKEVYIRMDVDGDGQQEEILAVIDWKLQKFLFYDYFANHMDRRPFDVIHGLETVSKRWYGMGYFEMFEDRQHFVDLQFNRANFRSSSAGSVTFWNPQATREGRMGLPLLVGRDAPYTLQDGYKGADAVEQVHLGEDDPIGKALMELTIQVTQVESGMVSAGDGNFSGLPASETATGIHSIERSGDVNAKYILTLQADAVTRLLQNAQAILLENMKDRQVYFYRQGDVSSLVELNKDEIRRLNLQVKLVLTRSRSSELMDSSKLAKEIAVEYYTLPPNVQVNVRPLYLQMLKALEISDADIILALPAIDPNQPPPDPNAPPSATPQAPFNTDLDGKQVNPVRKIQDSQDKAMQNAVKPLGSPNARPTANPTNGQLSRTPVATSSQPRQ